MTKIKTIWRKFKRLIIGFLIGGTALAAGLSGIPQDLYNNLNVKVYTVCNPQEARITSIADSLKTIKARNPDNSLREITAQERAGVKSCEIAKRGLEYAGEHNSPQYGVKIDIIGEVKAIEVNGQHGVELFAKAWRGTQQLGFGADGSIEIERFRIFNPPILVDDPNGIIIRENISIDGVYHQRKLREDPIEAIKQVIAHNATLVGKDNNKIVSGKVGNTTSTFYPDADPESTSVDGSVFQDTDNTAWGTLQADVGSGSNDTGTDQNMVGWRDGTSSNFSRIMRWIELFDTSAIPDTDTISSATLSNYGTYKEDPSSNTPSTNIYSAAPASNTSLAAGDYDSLGTTAYATAITYASYNDAGYNNWALNATGIAAISKTGISKFGVRNVQYDVENTAPAPTGSLAWNRLNVYTADQTGTANDPKLVVVHSVPSAVTGEEYTNIFGE